MAVLPDMTHLTMEGSLLPTSVYSLWVFGKCVDASEHYHFLEYFHGLLWFYITKNWKMGGEGCDKRWWPWWPGGLENVRGGNILNVYWKWGQQDLWQFGYKLWWKKSCVTLRFDPRTSAVTDRGVEGIGLLAECHLRCHQLEILRDI